MINRRRLEKRIQEYLDDADRKKLSDMAEWLSAQELAELAIEYFRSIHSSALAAHCECLGMNAENMWAAIANSNPVYTSKHYFEMMQKWGLVDEKGEPLI